MIKSASGEGAAEIRGADSVEIPFWHLSIGAEERAAVAAAMTHRNFSMGPVVQALEAEIARQLGVPYVVCTSSGTAALLMSVAVSGVGPGDEVLVPTRTFIASANAVMLLGANPVLVDCQSDRQFIDIDDAERKITSRTKAIMPVHLNGRGEDMAAIMALAARHGLTVIEDACQSLLSRHPLGYLGTIGHIGCFSFSMVKLVSSGQGGAAVTYDKPTYDKLRRFRNNGVEDVLNHTYAGLGGNFKYTDLAAAIGSVQFGQAERKIGHVNAIYRRYRKGLSNLSFLSVLPVDIEHGEVALSTQIVSDRRDDLFEHLNKHRIGARKFIPSCHSEPLLEYQAPLPRADVFFRRGLSLPSGPDMPMAMVDWTIDCIRGFIQPGDTYERSSNRRSVRTFV